MAETVLKVILDGSENVNSGLKDISKGFVNLSEEQNKTNSEIKKGLKDSTEAVKKSSESVVGLAKDLKFAGTSASDLSSKFSGLKGAVSTVVKSLGTLKGAIIATGIGALIIAVTSLIALFAKTKEGGDKLEQVMKGLGAAFDVFIGLAGRAGKAIVSVFTEPLAALEKFGNFLAHPIDGMKSLGNVIAETGKKALQAGKEQALLTKQLQDLEDAERQASLVVSKNQTQIDKLLVQSKNRSLSEKERIKLLDEASILEEKNLEIQKKLANESLRIIAKENEALKANGTLQDANEEKEIAAKLKIDELERGSLVLQEKITNRRNALTEEITSNNEKARLKKEEISKKESERLLKEIAEREKQVAAFKKLSQDELNNTLKIVEQETNAEAIALKERFAKREINEDQFNEALTQIKLNSLQKQIKDLEDYAKTVDGVDLEIVNRKLEAANLIVDGIIAANAKTDESNKKTAALEEEITQLRLSLASSFVTGISNLIAQDEERRKEFGVLLKTLAVAEIAVNLAKQISAINAAAAANPLNAVTFGAAGLTQSGLQTAIAIATAAFQTASVLSQGFEKGGYTGDGGKSEVAGVVHKGEFVTTKEDTKKHRGLLEAIHEGRQLSLVDISSLLKGTGVGLMPDVIPNTLKSMEASSNQKLYQQEKSDKNIAELNENFKKWMQSQGNDYNKTLPDGTQIIKVGNTIRKITKRRL